MRIIYKYELHSSRTILDLPLGAQVLTAQVQGATVVLWAHFEQDEVRRQRRAFAAINTGVTFDLPIAAYLGTVRSDTGIVWHIFEVAP